MAAKKKATKKASGGAQGSKTKFVLDLPHDMSAKEVSAKAKAAGLDISEGYVYKIRSTAKAGASKKAGKRAGAKATAPTRKSGAPNKAEFVRSLPPGTSYAEAAEKAAALGIKLSKAYYYVLKSEAKKAGKGGAAAPRGRAAAKRGGSVSVTGLRLTSNDPNEQALIDAVRTLGGDRARELIAAIEKFERG